MLKPNPLIKPKRTSLILVLFLLVILSACSNQQSPKEPISGSQAGEPVPANAPGGQRPSGIANMPKEALFVSQYTLNQVVVVDLESGKTVKEIPVGAKPIALTKSPDNRYVYVANSGTGDVYMISTSTGDIEAKIIIGNQPVAMTINEAGDKLYVVDYYFNRVSVVDLKLRSMTGYYELNTYGFEERMEPPDCCSGIFGEPMGAGRKPSAIVLDEKNNKIYVGNLGTWDVAVIDLKEEKEVKAFDATFGINKMFLTGSKDTLFISAVGNEEEINTFILKLDLKGGGSKDKIQIGGKPVNMALSADGQIIYIVTQEAGKLSGLSISNGKIIGQSFLEGRPGDIVLSEDGSKAYVTDLLNGTIQVLDLKSFSLLKTIEVGVTPNALVYTN